MALTKEAQERIKKLKEQNKNLGSSSYGDSSSSSNLPTKSGSAGTTTVGTTLTPAARKRIEGLREKSKNLGFRYSSHVVDDNYINNFISESQNFMKKYGTELNNLDYKTATGDSFSSYYNSVRNKETDLKNQATTIRDYLSTHRGQIDEQRYKSLSNYLDEFSKTSMTNLFDQAKDYYSQWKTEDEYNFWQDHGTVESRKKWYAEQQSNLEKLKAEKKAADAQWNEALVGYDPESYEFQAASQEFYGKQKALEDEIAAVETEMRNYERGNYNEYGQYYGDKDLDAYAYVMDKPDFSVTSKNRNYINPTKEDLWKYDLSASDGSVALNNGGSFDDAGNIRDADGNIVTSAKGPEVKDKLGLFLAAGDDGVNEAYNYLSAGQGNITNTWANIMQEGDVSGWKYIEEPELDIYYALLSESQEKAYQYLEELTPELNRRETVAFREYVEEAPALQKVLLNVGSIPMNVIGGGVAFVSDAVNTLQGEEINPYSRTHAFQNAASTIRDVTATDINNLTGNAALPWLGTTWGDAYQALMSAGDTLFGSALGSGAYQVLMGMGAASSEAKRLYEQGASMGQIAAGGVLAGATEAFFEHYSVENLQGIKKMLETPGVKPMDFVKKWLLQSGIEATEEMATELANTITNAMVMGSQSDMQKYVNKYLAEGFNDTQALVQALLNDVAPNVLNAGISGLISGAAGGGLPAVVGVAQSSKQAIIDKQVAAAKYKEVLPTAIERLKELGETENVDKIAKLVAKKVSGQQLTRAEKRTLVEGFGSQVAKEIEQGMNNVKYKSITERVGEESSYGVSKSGQTTLRNENDPIVIDEVLSVGEDKMTVKLADGREVNASDINFANDSESYLYSAVANMENMTPAAATALIKNIDLASEQSVQEYVNGVDEAYTYGYHGYSESDLKAGEFTKNLSDVQMMSAYELGQSARRISDEAADAPIVKMRTAAEAKLTAKQKNTQLKAQFASDDVDVYFEDGGNVVKFDEHNAGQYDEKRMAGVNAAKFLSKMGIGGKYYFYESYVKNGVRVYKDSNGNEVKAPNGIYTSADGSIHIDMNAGDDGQGTTAYTLGHELGHFVKDQSKKQFKVLSDLVTEAYSKSDMTMHERVLEKQKQLSDIRGEDVSYDEAYEEVVADALSTMFTDGNIYEKLTELKTKDRGLWNTIKKFFEDLVSKFKEFYAKLTPDQKDAQDIREMKEMFDRIQTAFAEALVEASDNFRASEQVLAQAGIAVNAETNSGSLYSVRYLLNETDQKKAVKALVDRFNVSATEAMDWLKAETSLASLILNPKYSSFLDYEADPNEVAIKQNSDYPQGTVDFSNICKKRREFTQVMNRILRNFPNHVFAATDLAKIRTIMGEEGMTLPCGICYVEDRRQLDTIVAQDFISGLKLYRDGSKTRPDGKPFNANQLKGLQLTDGDTYVPTIYELVTLEGRNSLKAKNPNMESAWVKYNNARGMQAVRLLTNEAEYKRQILKYSPKTVQTKNDYGGLRIYSFSDAEMFHLIDIIQVLTDCAAVGLKVQGYTKVNEYAKAVKDTGEKLNRSLIPLGDLGYHMENGKVVLDYDPVEGIDINSEDFFDSKDNPDVGNIVIGINPTQIRAAMVSDFIDYIIPFHTGQSAEVLGEKGIAAWINYKDSQSEIDLATGKKSAHQINIYTEVFQAAENEGKPIRNKRDFVEKFLDVCKENGLKPRFAEFLNTDAKGNYVYTEGYHKFLVDFKTFAQTEVGEYLPQNPVKPIFENSYITSLLSDYVAEQQAKDAEVAEQMPKVIERITNEIVKPGTEKRSDRKTFKTGQNANGVFVANALIDLANIESEWWTGRYNHDIFSMSKSDDTEFVQFHQEIEKRTKDMEEYGEEKRTVDESFIVRDGKGKEFIYHVELDGYLHGVVLEKIDKAKYTATFLRQTKGGQNGKSTANIKGRIRTGRSGIGQNHSGSGRNRASNGNSGHGGMGSGSSQSNMAGNDERENSLDQEVSAVNKTKTLDELSARIKWLSAQLKNNRVSKEKKTEYRRELRALRNEMSDRIGGYFPSRQDKSKHSDRGLPSMDAYEGKTPTRRELWDDIAKISLSISSEELNLRSAERNGYADQIKRVRSRLADIQERYIEYGDYLLHNYDKYSLEDIRSLSKALRLFEGFNASKTYTIEQFKNGLSARLDAYRKDTEAVMREELKGMSREDRKLYMALKLLAAQADYDASNLDGESEVDEEPYEEDWLDDELFFFSERTGDSVSNRHLLANAFEGLSQNSEEYKMIQDYKGRIKELNELETKLSQLNAEIRKIRFGTEGARDTARLRQLEDEAKDVAKEINRYDKRLLSMEASEPLRKVIDRERKKEAQKTKAHVQEIQKNKKLRAEQTELRHKIRRVVRDLDKLLNRGNKKQNVKEDMKDFVSKALELADYIFTDHISNDELIRRGITVPMRGNEAQLVKETEDILTKLYDQADSLTDEEFTRLDEKRKKNLDKLRDLLTEQRNERLNTPVAKLFDDLVKAYASLKNSSQDAVKAAYNEELENSLRAFMGDEERAKILENMRVADMTTEELNWLYRAYTMVLINVRDANKFHVKGMTETIDQMVTQIVMEFGSRKIPDKKLAIAAQKLSNKIGWDYEKLYYALDRIGSKAFTKLMMNLADSENTVMEDIMEAVAFRDEMVEKYGFNNWDVSKKIDREFLDNTGKKFSMTLGQMMSLYAYSRRKGAWDHIEYGGFVFGEAALTDPKPADSYKLSKEQCEAITNLLTKEQKGYVEDMQKFLSETMGEKGNEVSMLLYGIKMFTEENYFPIHIAGQFKAQAQESQAKAAEGFGSMSNAGFTHAQNPNAKAPFVLESFNDVWSDHVNEMSRYHGTVPALEDIRRVMNRSSYSQSTAESTSVKVVMENHFGKEAVKYFDNLYREANSGAITDKLQHTSKKMLSLFRKNSVAYSLSVLVQQPASLVRAYAMIDRKYFGVKGVGTITSGVTKAVTSKWNKAYSKAYNEMLKYAPGVTMAKEIGGFDTATGGSIRSYLLDTNKTFVQKMKTENIGGKVGAVAALVDDNPIANLPNVADKIAWIEIWNACKRETVSKHKDLKPGSDEFLKVVGDRFTEVIRATQVYDSIFAKSPMLKSKNLAVQYLVSFMNEPNTTANMVESALRDVSKGNWKSGLRTAHVVIHSIIFTNVLKSLIYALRDDDEEEAYIEKYIESIVGGLVDDFNPLNYIPIARDVWSVAQGYDVERADMAIVADAIGALNNVIKAATTDKDDLTEDQLIELDKKQTEANWKLVESVAAFFGIPVKNIRREINAVIDHARIASANAGQTTKLSLSDSFYEAVIESIPFMSSKKSKQDKLYNAIISGDDTYVARLKSGYKNDDAYNNAVRKALRENDPRIKEAAIAWNANDLDEYMRIAKGIIAEKNFVLDDVVMAIRAEASALAPDEGDSGAGKAKGLFTAEKFAEAVAQGDWTTAKAVKSDLIQTAQKNGKTAEEAEKSFVSSAKGDLKELFIAGSINESKAVNALTSYCGETQEEAEKRVGEWAFEGDYGFSYSDRGDAYKSGAISADELRSILVTAGGMTAEEADLQIKVYDWQKEGFDIDSNQKAVVEDYEAYCEPIGIEKRTYFNAYLFYTESGEEGVKNSKVKECMPYINSLPLTAHQKTELAKCFWAESTVRRYKTW